MAKLSTLSLGRICGPVDGMGEAVTISVSVGAKVATGVDEVVVGMVVVVVAGDGNGGKLVIVVVCGVVGADDAPESGPPMAGTDDTGGSCKGKVGLLDEAGDSKVKRPEKLGVVVDCGLDDEANTDSTMDSAIEAVLSITASWLGASEVATSGRTPDLLLSVASPISASSGILMQF